MSTKNLSDPLDDKINGGDSDEEIIEIAKRRFKLAEEAEAENRENAVDDLRFLSGDQWPDKIKADRAKEGRPCLVINRLTQYLKQITNDQRQNRPSIKVNPVDDKADIDTAKIFQGLIRHIEYNSNADVAYDTAFDASAGTGLGYYRIISDYCDPHSFDQELLIKQIPNRFSVYLDPSGMEPDGSDGNWGLIFENMPHEDYNSQFKDSDTLKNADWGLLTSTTDGWITESTIRVAEYFYKTFKKVTIVQLSDGTVIEKDKLPKELPEGLAIQNERETILPAIKWVKLNGAEILEKQDWPGQWIPIIPVKGDEINIDGKRILQGIIRNSKDPQRMYNYWNTNATETIALAPKAPFIGYAGQFQGFENKWNEANVKNFPYLEVNPKMIGGQPAPFPQRNVYEPPINAITNVMMHAADDMKATTGIYDAALGNRSNENSGIAIQRRNMQTQTGNFHFMDNLTRSIRHGGRILIDLIPYYYDGPRAQRILGEDGSPEIVHLNQVFQEGGQDKIYQLGHGKYDCTVSTGPSYATKRQEAVADMLEFTKALPQSAQLIADLIARHSDWPAHEEIADRLKKGLPPGIADDDKDNPNPIPPQVQQQMQQMSQMIGQLSQHLHAAQDELDQKTRELESKERIALTQVQAQIEIALAKMQSEGAQALLAHEVGSIETRLNMIGQNEPIENESEPAAGPQGSAQPSQSQPPTGGPSPGQPMGS